jgi:hypothetical protein
VVGPHDNAQNGPIPNLFNSRIRIHVTGQGEYDHKEHYRAGIDLNAAPVCKTREKKDLDLGSRAF